MKRFIFVVVLVLTSGLLLRPRPSQAHMPGCYIVWADAPPMPGSGNAYGKPEKESKSKHEPSLRRDHDERFHYSAAEMLDLDFHVLLPASSDRAIELRILTPQGHLYQTLELEPPRPVIVEVGVESDENSRARGKSSSKKPKQRGRRVKPRFVWASAKLPVAGTTIVNNSLYGRWTAVPYLKGDSTPCTRPRVFELRP